MIHGHGIQDAGQKTDKAAYDAMSNAVNPYGDGQASRRIVQAILYTFGNSTEKPNEFTL